MSSLVEAPKVLIKDPRNLDFSSKVSTSDEESKQLNTCEFLSHIGRPELQETITHRKPYVYWTDELYGWGIKGNGGKGMLASDTLTVAKETGLPMVCITNFYRKEKSFELDDNFNQKVVVKDVSSEERGYADTGININLSTYWHSEVKINFVMRQEGSVTVICPTEPNLGLLYEGETSSDRRLYQDIVLGFGGHKALEALGFEPSMNQVLNEAPTVFAALATLDTHLTETKNFKKALSDIKKIFIYTNHTTVPAADACISLQQFDNFVMPNIKNEELKDWLREKINKHEGRIYLSMLAIELSGKKNGVSKIHAKKASEMYRDCDGNCPKFEAITNGIALSRWANPEILNILKKHNVMDKFNLPTENYKENLDIISEAEIIAQRQSGKLELIDHLYQRKDQYGKPVIITEGAKIADWSRRVAGYKRAGMLVHDPVRLANILETQNTDLVMAGNAHPDDVDMRREIKRILEIIDNNEILKKRVHFIQDYDEDLGKALARGSDIAINTPRVGEEACGTSGMKKLINGALILSTRDGWLADPFIAAMEEGKPDHKPAYLEIAGKNYEEEVESLYLNLVKGARIIDGKAEVSLVDFIKGQYKDYLHIACGARMEVDYLNLGFPAATTVFTA